MPERLRRLVRPWVPPIAAEWYRARRQDPRVSEARREREQLLAARDLLPQRSLAELFPGIEAVELEFPAAQIARRRDMVLPLPDLLWVAALCRHRRPRRVFEIGTYTGATTLLMAMNTPEDSEILTLDLDPAEIATSGLGAAGIEPFQVGGAFAAHPAAAKIRQLFGDSRGLDPGELRGTMDLVFVDADHTYEFVKSDSRLAFELLRPGGVVIWDDYAWPEEHPECAGVTRFVNELSATRPCFRIAGTRMAVYVDVPGHPAARA